MTVQLDYAYKDNKIVYIDDVATGLPCGCICPECGGQLIAKNGGFSQAHHFMHYSLSEDTFHIHDVNPMTRAHKLTQYIISEGGVLELTIPMLEPITISYGVGITEQVINIDNQQIRADILTNDNQYIFEIAVTHSMGNEKIKLLDASEYTTFELHIPRYFGHLPYNTINHYIKTLHFSYYKTVNNHTQWSSNITDVYLVTYGQLNIELLEKVKLSNQLTDSKRHQAKLKAELKAKRRKVIHTNTLFSDVHVQKQLAQSDDEKQKKLQQLHEQKIKEQREQQEQNNAIIQDLKQKNEDAYKQHQLELQEAERISAEKKKTESDTRWEHLSNMFKDIQNRDIT